MRSTRTRLKMSPQVSSSAMRMPAVCAARGECVAIRLAVRQRRQQIDAGETRERFGDASAAQVRRKDRRCGRGKLKLPGAGRRAAARSNRDAIPHQRHVGFAGAIPFDHA